MVDERKQYVCCESADDEQLEHEAELFDCASCPVAHALERAWPENLQAWRIFNKVAGRLVVEAHLGQEVFRRLTEDLDAETVSDVVERIELIHRIVNPRKTE